MRNKMVSIGALTMLLWGPSALSQVTGQNANLSMLWNRVKTNSADLRASSERIIRQDEKYIAAYFGVLPSLDVELTQSTDTVSSDTSAQLKTHERRLSIELRQPLLDLPQWEIVRLSSSEGEIARLLAENTTYELRRETMRIFISLVSRKQKLALYQMVSESDLKGADERIASVEASGLKGTISSSFELSRLSQFQGEMIELASDVTRYQLALNELTGLPAMQLSADLLRIALPPAATIPPKIKTVTERLAALTLERNESAVRLDRLRMVPSLYGFTNRTQVLANGNGREADSTSYSSGIGLSWTISSGIRGLYDASAAAAESRALSIELGKIQKAQNLRIQTLQQLIDSSYSQARTSIKLADRGLKMLTAARDQKKAGLIPMTEYYSTAISAVGVYSNAVEAVTRYLLLKVEQRHESGSLDDTYLASMSLIFSPQLAAK